MNNKSRAWTIAMAILGLAIGVSAAAGIMKSLERGKSTTALSTGKAGAIWGADYFPNVPLVTHEGETVHFFDDLLEDKVVAINFIYTTCPDACPMETARLMEVKDILGDRLGKDIFFYSITIDPENDTPEVLGQFAESWGIPEGWTFLTGNEDDIIQLRKKFGVYIEEIQAEDSNDHNLSLVIGNQASGRWMKRSPYENPYVLANQLGSWLHNWKIASTEKRDYADAPELRTISKGEDLFRTRCASCHTIGGGDVARDRRRIGPDLFNVTKQRDPEWLNRWMAEPDKMIEEEDPLAMSLMAQFNNVPMPNLRLNQREIDLLLEHIEEESDRLNRLAAAPSHKDHHGDHGGDHQDHSMHADHADHQAHGDHGSHADHQDPMAHGDHGQHGERAAHGDHGDPHEGHH